MHGYFIIITNLNFQLCIQIHQKLKLESNPFSPTCAGETTLRRSMARSLEKGVGVHFIPLVEIIELQKPFKCCLNDPNEWSKRTRGIDIKVLVDNPNMKVSIWDLAGQEEYHAFHDMMLLDLSIQGNVYYFLLVCNPFLWDQSRRPKTPQELEDEFSYWLKFISSNKKRSSNLHHE
jgi:hypothetical protein